MKRLINFAQYQLQNRLLHLALLVGQVAIGVVFAFLGSEAGTTAPSPELNELFVPLVPLAGLALVAGALLVFRMLLNRAGQKTDLASKLVTYRAALIMRWAVVEAAALLALVAYFLTTNALYLYCAAIGGAIFAFFHPWPGRTETDLNLSQTELEQLPQVQIPVRGSGYSG
jgi:hypothetical protein